MPPVVAAVATFAASSALASFAVQIGVSVALSLVSRVFFRPSQETVQPDELIRDLAIPKSRPKYRFVYGRYPMLGSPAPWRSKGKVLYGALILNSRRSAGGQVKFYVDKREPINIAGDLYDFAGDGLRFNLPDPATPFDTDERPRFWLSLGDQTSPPARFTDNAPELFKPTDGWQGRTVLWVELHAGATEHRADAWPRVPPEIEVEMDWSCVWDPSDPAQDPDDESTWTWSDNQALIVLDALRRNPIRRFDAPNLMIETFAEAADACNELIPLKAGGSERRYTANGFIIWDGREIEEQVQPIVDSGAGTLVRTGGRLGYLAGVYRPPVYTATDILADGGVEFQRLAPGRDLPRGIYASYINPNRDWRPSDLPVRAVPGAPALLGDDGVSNIKLPFCTSATQAMRVQKIAALKASAQKRLSVTLPPDAFNVVAGANIVTDLPVLGQLNGEWELSSVNPGLSLSDHDGGVALRVPVRMGETSPDFYAWDPADEYDIAEEPFDATKPALDPPSDLDVISGPDQVVSGLPRIKFSFLPSSSGSVEAYEWQIAKVGDEYGQGGMISAALVSFGSGRVTEYATSVDAGTSYKIRVRATSTNRSSAWVEDPSTLAIGAHASATGGVVTEPLIDGERWRVHTFTSDGSLSVSAPGDMDYLVVAGGGGGGGGGGGAGGMLSGSSPIAIGAHAIVVGAGGGGTAFNAPGGNGGDSSAFGVVAIGGGGGGAEDAAPGDEARAGGSGGGGGGGSGIVVGGAGTIGQGNDGGSGSAASPYPSGGGGGAGAVGGNAVSSTPGDGGAGLASDITGTTIYYAGGGGGARSTGVTGSGGIGGGGAGGVSGVDGTGGGGGAGWSGQTPGDGGDGIVIVRYRI